MPHQEHAHKPKHKPKHKGPKERELAVALTVAILGASKVEGSLQETERNALGIYGRMLAAVQTPETDESAA